MAQIQTRYAWGSGDPGRNRLAARGMPCVRVPCFPIMLVKRCRHPTRFTCAYTPRSGGSFSLVPAPLRLVASWREMARLDRRALIELGSIRCGSGDERGISSPLPDVPCPIAISMWLPTVTTAIVCPQYLAGFLPLVIQETGCCTQTHQTHPST